MNIELDEVVVMVVSDDALEQAADGTQANHTGLGCLTAVSSCCTGNP